MQVQQRRCRQLKRAVEAAQAAAHGILELTLPARQLVWRQRSASASAVGMGFLAGVMPKS